MKRRHEEGNSSNDSMNLHGGIVVTILIGLLAVSFILMLMALLAYVGLPPAYSISLSVGASLAFTYYNVLIPYQLGAAQRRMAELDQAQREHEQRTAGAPAEQDISDDDRNGLAAPGESTGLYRDDLRPLDAKLVLPERLVVKRSSTAPVTATSSEPPKILS